MRDFIKSLKADTRGGVLIYTAILMPVFLGFMALGLDIGAWHIEKRQSQTMADSAAVAGVIYAKNQDVSFTGQSGSDQSLFIIADKVEMSGGVTITNLNADGSPIFFNAFLIQGKLVE